ncbi:MAG: hypothetical protein M3O46_02025 [Myxococcota bacterium]|nr:hypothetical protein [Myxococcota bacterium]
MRIGRTLVALSWMACCGCALRQMLATSDDLADYRAFRVAAHEGTRLARAQTYLKRHPRGAWAEEVRQAFELEEATWFEDAKTSRARAREYVVDLPHGPHVEAARAILLLPDEHDADLDTLELLTDSRRTAAILDLESATRARVGEVVLEDLSALLDPGTWGTDLDHPPQALAVVLRGVAPWTWGVGGPLGLREDELFYVLRTQELTEARVVKVRLLLGLDRGRVAQGQIDGADLFVRWAEASQIRSLDATAASDHAAAVSYVLEVLSGALEARFPASLCTVRPHTGEILRRACIGWTLSVRTGVRPGDDDVIAVRGPSR